MNSKTILVEKEVEEFEDIIKGTSQNQTKILFSKKKKKKINTKLKINSQEKNMLMTDLCQHNKKTTIIR